MAEPMLADEIMNRIRDSEVMIKKLIREHGENSDEVEVQQAMLDHYKEKLEKLGVPQRAAESNEQMKQREIELEILEREDRIGRACGTCERLKSELEEYKMEMGMAASSPERNARIQAARAEKAMRNEENAKDKRELEEALAKQSAEYEAEVAAAVAKLQANEGAASAAAASAAAAAPPKKSLFGSLFGKKGGRRRTTRRRIARSKKTRRNYRR